MKKFTMFSSVLASALMLTVASCSSEDVAGGDSQNDKGATSFLAVNIENVGSAPASRSYEQNKGTYEDGTADESKITNVRFYFLMVMVLHICWLIKIQIMIQRSNLLTIWNKKLRRMAMIMTILPK